MNNSNRSYNLDIYSLKTIKTAIRYYSEICRIEYKVKEHYVVCSFYADEEYIEQIEMEFDNFLIELMHHEGMKHDDIA